MILTSRYSRTEIKMPLSAAVRVNRMAYERISSGTEVNNIQKDRSKLLRESTKAKMIERFSLLITVMDQVDLDDMCNKFQIECHMYPALLGMSRSEDILLTMLKKSADECYRFKEYLQTMDTKKAIDGLMRPLDDDIPMSFKEKYKDVSIKNVKDIRYYLEDNLEIKALLIPLLERGVLPLEEYINIKSQRSLVDQKRLLISLLIDRGDSDLLIRFLYVLNKDHQTDVLKSLKTGEITEIHDDLAVAFCRTNIIVKSTEIPNRSAEYLNSLSEAELSMNLLDVRKSSIVLRLQTRSEKDFCVLVSSIDRLERFFEKMYANLKIEKSERRQICVTIQQIPKYQFIHYRKSKNETRENEDECIESDQCLMCLQEVVRTNVKTFVAEIESDIIAQTFDKIPEITKFVRSMCMDKEITPSRQQRAIKFLTYALHDEKCLCTFYKIFSSTSNSEIIPAKCTKCVPSEAADMELYSCQDKMQEVAMSFVLYKDNGHIMVKYSDIPSPNHLVTGAATRTFQLPNKVRQTPSNMISSCEYQQRNGVFQQKNEDVNIKKKPRQKRLQNIDSHTILQKSHHFVRQRSMPDMRANWIQDNLWVLDILEEQAEEIVKLKTFIDYLSFQNIQLKEGFRNMMTEGMHYRGGNGHRLQNFE